MTFPTIGPEAYIRHDFSSSDLSNGDIIFEGLNDQIARNLLVEHFVLVDSSDEIVTPNSGLVTFSVATEDDVFTNLVFGKFQTIMSDDPWWARPHGYGRFSKFKINKFFVDGVNATGFRIIVSQY